MDGADHLFAIILLVSGAVGFFRGFIRESIALAAWLVGLWLAWHFAYIVNPWLGGALASRACASGPVARSCSCSCCCSARLSAASFRISRGARRARGDGPPARRRVRPVRGSSSSASSCSPAAPSTSTSNRWWEHTHSMPAARSGRELARALRPAGRTRAVRPGDRRRAGDLSDVRHRRNRRRPAVNQRIYDALTVLQHRGQDAAGIMTCDEHELFVRKDTGLVRDVFRSAHMRAARRATSASATCAIRPPAATARTKRSRSTSTAPFGIVPRPQRQPDQRRAAQGTMCSKKTAATSTPTPIPKCCSTCSRSELQRVARPASSTPADIFARGRAACHRRCRGGYAVVAMIIGHGIARLPRPARHPPARARQARDDARASSRCSPRRAWRSTCSGFTLDARRRAGRGGLHRRARPPARAAVRAGGAPHALHLRVRVLRAPGLDHRQHLRATRRACAWARSSPRRSCAMTPGPRHRRRDPDPRHRAGPARCSWRTRSA